MTQASISHRESFDWEDAKQRLARLAQAIDVGGSCEAEDSGETLARRARELAVSPRDQTPESDSFEVLTFRIGADVYALETEYILEMKNLSTLTVVPGCPGFLRGISNLRGEILAVLDLPSFFGLGKAPDVNQLLVLGHERPEYGIAITHAEEVRTISRSKVDLPALAIPQLQREFLLGMTPDATLLLDGAALLNDRRLIIDET